MERGHRRAACGVHGCAVRGGNELWAMSNGLSRGLTAHSPQLPYIEAHASAKRLQILDWLRDPAAHLPPMQMLTLL